MMVPAPWACTAVKGVPCGSTNSEHFGSLNLLKALTLLKQLQHGGATFRESVFPWMQLLLKEAEEKCSGASTTAG